jgi:drug/metabolite transporter (DMT)-like permease
MSFEFFVQVPFPNRIRYWRKIPNPFFGPKEVRPLLVVRGLTGYDSTFVLVNASHHYHRFTALSGMFFSLKYLSLSDAVVLRFIAPILTGFTGTIFLKERVSLKEFVAGCKYFVI